MINVHVWNNSNTVHLNSRLYCDLCPEEVCLDKRAYNNLSGMIASG